MKVIISTLLISFISLYSTHSQEIQTARFGHSATMIDGKMYVFGGVVPLSSFEKNSDSPKSNADVTASLIKFNETEGFNKVDLTGNPTARYAHGAVEHDGNILVVAGDQFRDDYLRGIGSIDVAAGTYDVVDGESTSYLSSAVVQKSGDKLAILGGWTKYKQDFTLYSFISESTYLYDLSSEKMEYGGLGDMRNKFEAASTVTDDGTIAIFGGRDENRDPIDKLSLYDPITDEYQDVDFDGTKPPATYQSAGVFYENQDGAGVFRLYGGITNEGVVTDKVFDINLDEKESAEVGTMPEGLAWHSATVSEVTEDQTEVLILGGKTSENTISSKLFKNTIKKSGGETWEEWKDDTKEWVLIGVERPVLTMIAQNETKARCGLGEDEKVFKLYEFALKADGDDWEVVSLQADFESSNDLNVQARLYLGNPSEDEIEGKAPLSTASIVGVKEKTLEFNVGQIISQGESQSFSIFVETHSHVLECDLDELAEYSLVFGVEDVAAQPKNPDLQEFARKEPVGKDFKQKSIFYCAERVSSGELFPDIQTALTYEPIADGETIEVCEGYYRVGSTINMGKDVAVISKSGKDKTYISADAALYDDPIFAPKKDFSISGFKILSASHDGEPIGAGIAHKGGALKTNRIQINDCYFKDFTAVLKTEKNSLNDVIISNSEFDNCRSAANDYAASIKFSGNKGEDISGFLIDMQRVPKIEISDNIIKLKSGKDKYDDVGFIRGCYFSGEIFGNETSLSEGENFTPYSYGIVIEDCSVLKSGDEKLIIRNNLFQKLAYGTEIVGNKPDYVRKVEIRDNNYFSNKTGIRLRDCAEFHIYGNVIRENGVGIELLNSFCKIYGNILEKNGKDYSGSFLGKNDSPYESTGIGGLILNQSSPRVEGNYFSADSASAVTCYSGSQPTLRRNIFSGNVEFAVNNLDPAATADARENYWGNASGPSGFGDGTGDAISEGVTFEDFLEAPQEFFVFAAADTVYARKNEDAVITFSARNYADYADDFEFVVSDSEGWLASSAEFTITPTDSLGATASATFSAPSEEGSSEIDITANSVSRPDLSDADKTVLISYEPRYDYFDISPKYAEVPIGGTVEFSSRGFDQNGFAFDLPEEPTWIAQGGEIDDNGVFTAGDTPGEFAIECEIDGQNKTANVRVFDPSVSVESRSNAFPALSIFPNPSRESVRISFYSESAGRAKLKITSIAGLEIYSGAIETREGLNETELDVRNLSVGIFFVTLTDERGKIYSGKLSIIK